MAPVVGLKRQLQSVFPAGRYRRMKLSEEPGPAGGLVVGRRMRMQSREVPQLLR